MLWTAFLLGLASSLHCVGMCGPIALALPLPVAARWRMAAQALNYHAGRILTYGLLGLLFGLLGKGIEVAGFQKLMSIVAGVFMLAMALFSFQLERNVLLVPGLGAWLASCKPAWGRCFANAPALQFSGSGC